MSSMSRFLNSAGVVGAGSLPNVCMRSTVAGSLRMRTTSALSRLRIGSGRPAADQFHHRRRAAAIGHVQHLDLGLDGEQFDGEMRTRTDAGRAVEQGVWPFMGGADQFGDTLDAAVDIGR